MYQLPSDRSEDLAAALTLARANDGCAKDHEEFSRETVIDPLTPNPKLAKAAGAAAAFNSSTPPPLN
jgi:hypothetical protein